jgi:NAD(P)-dependent dehydrogenase (short-subunit alcohol dehydrogenase family)
MGRLDGKVAVITGAAGGMGREAALVFAAEGARVCVADVDGENGERTASEAGDAFFFEVDVTQPESVQTMYAATAERYGGIDVLYNNAGISPADDDSILETDVDAWQRVQDVNTKGVYLCCKYGIPYLLERGGGSTLRRSSRFSVQRPRRSPTRRRRARCSRCHASSACNSRAGECASTRSARGRSRRRCCCASGATTPQRRSAGSSTCRWAGSRNRARS